MIPDETIPEALASGIGCYFFFLSGNIRRKGNDGGRGERRR